MVFRGTVEYQLIDFPKYEAYDYFSGAVNYCMVRDIWWPSPALQLSDSNMQESLTLFQSFIVSSI